MKNGNSKPITEKGFLSLLDKADRIEVLVVRGGEADIIEATWFSSATEDEDDQNPVYVDSDSDSGGSICSRELKSAVLRNDGKVVLGDGRVVTFFAQLISHL